MHEGGIRLEPLIVNQKPTSVSLIVNDSYLLGHCQTNCCPCQQAEDPSVVTAEDDELMLVGSCYVKV